MKKLVLPNARDSREIAFVNTQMLKNFFNRSYRITPLSTTKATTGKLSLPNLIPSKLFQHHMYPQIPIQKKHSAMVPSAKLEFVMIAKMYVQQEFREKRPTTIGV